MHFAATLAQGIPVTLLTKGTVREAKNLREAFDKNGIQNSERVEIFAFPDGQMSAWMNAMAEAVEIYGEPSGHSFNLVANAVPFNFDFVKI